MRAHYIQHVPFEDLGSIQGWLRTAGYQISSTRLFESAALPDPDEIDLLVVLGGPMSVHDQEAYPWLGSEVQFVRHVIQSAKPVLGICLGAQLIAWAMGAEVYGNAQKEIGWFPIQGVSPADEGILRFPSSLEVFHWHGETFDLPTGAVHLARSEACHNQAFQIGRSVIGLQFHLETTPASARAIIENCRSELLPATYVQTEEAILAAGPETYRAINQTMVEVLGFLCQARR